MDEQSESRSVAIGTRSEATSEDTVPIGVSHKGNTPTTDSKSNGFFAEAYEICDYGRRFDYMSFALFMLGSPLLAPMYNIGRAVKWLRDLCR